MTQESIGQQINMDNIEQLLANVRTLEQHYATKLIQHLHPDDPLLHYFLKTKLKKNNHRNNKIKKEQHPRKKPVA